MIYLDQLFALKSSNADAVRAGVKHGHKWCHLWTDAGNEDELHAFAAQLGLKRTWFQPKPKFPHYDIVPTKRALALQLGAREASLRQWINQCRHKITQPSKASEK